ncbi:hypothetical protein U9M48_011452 [Paspalum notatum var. saurae]|uniref:F-box/LRR-repeat protein 15/At3g58940/PEG3-like LRR domain-containing protein n=1 Tax=Paspalum notatum var. saurae TaxID=547442 RepID=A0AAQ3WHJ4_PASNO
MPNPQRRPPRLAAIGVLTRAKKRELEEYDEEERVEDRISILPDAVLGEIVSLLPTKTAPARSRRFAVHLRDDPVLHLDDSRAAALDGWLRSPAHHNLQQLEFHHGGRRPPLPVSSVRRFSSTLRVASFGGFRFPDGGRGRSNASALLHLPLLQQLPLVRVRVWEKSLRALLAGCPVLESFLLLNSNGFRRLRIVSPSLRSIGVSSCWPGRRLHLQLLVIKDAPCLERLLFFKEEMMDISVISAPRLQIFGKLFSLCPMLHFGTTVTQPLPHAPLWHHRNSDYVQQIAYMSKVRLLKVLALSIVKLFLDPIINLMKCFPLLETLYIKSKRKIVLGNYLGNYSHVNFAKFFVSKARLLESMSLELGIDNVSNAWVEEQHRLLQIEKRASRGAQFKFVSPNIWDGPLHLLHAQQVHDLSTDPFQNFH